MLGREFLAILLLVGVIAGLVALVRPAVREAPASLRGVVVDDNDVPVAAATVRIKAATTASRAMKARGLNGSRDRETKLGN